MKDIAHMKYYLSQLQDTSSSQELPKLPIRRMNMRNKLLQQNTFSNKAKNECLLLNTRLKIRNSSLGYKLETETIATERKNVKVANWLLKNIPRKYTFHSADHSPSPDNGEKKSPLIKKNQLLQQINIDLKDISIKNPIPSLRHLKLAPLRYYDTILNDNDEISARDSIPQGKQCQLKNLELVSQYTPKILTQRFETKLSNKVFREDIVDKINIEMGGCNVTFGPQQFHDAVVSPIAQKGLVSVRRHKLHY